MKAAVFLFLFILSPACLAYGGPKCQTISPTIVEHMTLAMEQDFRLPRDSFVAEKTSVEFLYSKVTDQPVAFFIAQARQKRREGAVYDDSPVSLSEKEKALWSDSTNLIIKITYENKQGKQNSFITSSLLSDIDCSIRFNGYLVMQRQF